MVIDIGNLKSLQSWGRHRAHNTRKGAMWSTKSFKALRLVRTASIFAMFPVAANGLAVGDAAAEGACQDTFISCTTGSACMADVGNHCTGLQSGCSGQVVCAAPGPDCSDNGFDGAIYCMMD